MAENAEAANPNGGIPKNENTNPDLTEIIVKDTGKGVMILNPLTGQQYDGVFNGLIVKGSQFYSPTDGSPAQLSVDKAGKMYINGKPYSGYKGIQPKGQKSMDSAQQKVDRTESKMESKSQPIQKNHRGEIVNISTAVAKMKTITASKGGAGTGTNFTKSKK